MGALALQFDTAARTIINIIIMIQITDKVNCCGCNACGDICPKGSITFKTDIEGFSYPEVDMDKCIDCHLCEKTCPIINIKELKKNYFVQPRTFAAQNKNLDSLFNSTSGSAFAALAERMYKLGGYVGGAVFNEDYSVSQFISAEKADLEKIRNSKYVQSDSQGFYKQVKDLLVAGEQVLVCGLPCQMSALRTFLRKDYDNLIIVDLICLGINSPKILRGYLDYMEEKHNSKIVYYKAKNKEFGWRQLTTKIVFANGEVEYDKKDTNYFTHGFISTHAYSRPSCYECQFKGLPRFSDITIGDLWGAERIVGKDYDNDLGTSVIMTNSQKGLAFYESIKNSFREKEIPFELTLKGNQALIKSQPTPNIDREEFYKDLDQMKFEDFAKKYIKLPKIEQSLKNTLLNIAKFSLYIFRASGLNVKTLYQNIRCNLFSNNFKTNILNGDFLVFNKYCILNINKESQILVKNITFIGRKEVKGSTIETRISTRKGATIIFNGGTINYGADLEVFQDAELYLGNGIAFNLNATIICGCKIFIDDGVSFGRNVTIRDNNGGHFMSRRIYKDKRPVSIGKHSWICEQSTVMPGSKIGAGAVVGACSMVSGKLPNFTLSLGNPAAVVDEYIYWK